MNFLKSTFLLFILTYSNLYADNTVSCENNKCHFFIAQIPDTQGYFLGDIMSCGHTSATQIEDMYQWVFDKNDMSCPEDDSLGRGCYQHVFHVGDIVDGNGGDGSKMWSPANEHFTKIIKANTKEIPLGFATGNHDYTGTGPGHGIYNENNYQDAKAFLTKMYSEQKNADQIAYGPKYLPGSVLSPFVTYSEFTVGNQKVVALNLAFGLPADLKYNAVQDFIASNKDALFIISSHTFDGWDSAPTNSKLADLYNNNKNVFMVLWGHVPSNVNVDSSFQPIAGETISRNSMSPVYKYRYDFQEGGPYDCSPASNMPQHPLVRIYAFTLDSDNKTLSWQPYDAQAWNPKNKVYDNKIWQKAKDNPDSNINKGYEDVTPLGPKVTINFQDYINNNSCPAPVESKVVATWSGSTLQLKWPGIEQADAYEVYDWKGTNVLKTVQEPIYIQNIDNPSGSKITFFLQSNCKSGSSDKVQIDRIKP